MATHDRCGEFYNIPAQFELWRRNENKQTGIMLRKTMLDVLDAVTAELKMKGGSKLKLSLGNTYTFM